MRSDFCSTELISRGRILDGVIEVAVYAVVLGSILAFGAVEEWSLALMKFFCFLIFCLWVGRQLLFPSAPPGSFDNSAGNPNSSLLGITYRKTGLGIPIGLFLFVVRYDLVDIGR